MKKIKNHKYPRSAIDQMIYDTVSVPIYRIMTDDVDGDVTDAVEDPVSIATYDFVFEFVTIAVDMVAHKASRK